MSSLNRTPISNKVLRFINERANTFRTEVRALILDSESANASGDAGLRTAAPSLLSVVMIPSYNELTVVLMQLGEAQLRKNDLDVAGTTSSDCVIAGCDVVIQHLQHEGGCFDVSEESVFQTMAFIRTFEEGVADQAEAGFEAWQETRFTEWAEFLRTDEHETVMGQALVDAELYAVRVLCRNLEKQNWLTNNPYENLDYIKLTDLLRFVGERERNLWGLPEEQHASPLRADLNRGADLVEDAIPEGRLTTGQADTVAHVFNQMWKLEREVLAMADLNNFDRNYLELTDDFGL